MFDDFEKKAEGSLRVDNPEPRCPCVLLLDKSGSMNSKDAAGKTAIMKLNEGVQTLKSAINSDRVARKRVELSLVTFGDSVEVDSGFCPIDQFSPNTLAASGGTALGAALLRSMVLVERRKEEYKQHRMPYSRPWVILITDAQAQGMDAGWESAATNIRAAETDGRLILYTFGIEPADPAVLRKLSGNFVPAHILKENPGAIAELFQWLSRSVQSASQNAGGTGQVQLAPVNGFAVPV